MTQPTLLTPEDSKRVADALIKHIDRVGGNLNTLTDKLYTKTLNRELETAVSQGLERGVKKALGYNEYGPTQGFQRLLSNVEDILRAAVKR